MKITRATRVCPYAIPDLRPWQPIELPFSNAFSNALERRPDDGPHFYLSLDKEWSREFPWFLIFLWCTFPFRSCRFEVSDWVFWVPRRRFMCFFDYVSQSGVFLFFFCRFFLLSFWWKVNYQIYGFPSMRFSLRHFFFLNGFRSHIWLWICCISLYISSISSVQIRGICSRLICL